MMKRLVPFVVGVLMLQHALSAQDPPPPPAAKPPAAVPVKPAPPTPPPPPPGMSAANVNIRLELRISDNYLGTPTEKTVSMVIMSGNNARVRTASNVPVEPIASGRTEDVVLNVDATPHWIGQDQISARVTFEYRPAPAPSSQSERPVSPPFLNESLQVLLRNGQPLMVSQSADPATDRKVTVELTATILK